MFDEIYDIFLDGWVGEALQALTQIGVLFIQFGDFHFQEVFFPRDEEYAIILFLSVWAAEVGFVEIESEFFTLDNFGGGIHCDCDIFPLTAFDTVSDWHLLCGVFWLFENVGRLGELWALFGDGYGG